MILPYIIFFLNLLPSDTSKVALTIDLKNEGSIIYQEVDSWPYDSSLYNYVTGEEGFGFFSKRPIPTIQFDKKGSWSIYSNDHEFSLVDSTLRLNIVSVFPGRIVNEIDDTLNIELSWPDLVHDVHLEQLTLLFDSTISIASIHPIPDYFYNDTIIWKSLTSPNDTLIRILVEHTNKIEDPVYKSFFDLNQQLHRDTDRYYHSLIYSLPLILLILFYSIKHSSLQRGIEHENLFRNSLFYILMLMLVNQVNRSKLSIVGLFYSAYNNDEQFIDPLSKASDLVLVTTIVVFVSWILIIWARFVKGKRYQIIMGASMVCTVAIGFMIWNTELSYTLRLQLFVASSIVSVLLVKSRTKELGLILEGLIVYLKALSVVVMVFGLLQVVQTRFTWIYRLPVMPSVLFLLIGVIFAVRYMISFKSNRYLIGGFILLAILLVATSCYEFAGSRQCNSFYLYFLQMIGVYMPFFIWLNMAKGYTIEDTRFQLKSALLIFILYVISSTGNFMFFPVTMGIGYWLINKHILVHKKSFIISLVSYSRHYFSDIASKKWSIKLNKYLNHKATRNLLSVNKRKLHSGELSISEYEQKKFEIESYLDRNEVDENVILGTNMGPFNTFIKNGNHAGFYYLILSLPIITLGLRDIVQVNLNKSFLIVYLITLFIVKGVSVWIKGFFFGYFFPLIRGTYGWSKGLFFGFGIEFCNLIVRILDNPIEVIPSIPQILTRVFLYVLLGYFFFDLWKSQKYEGAKFDRTVIFRMQGLSGVVSSLSALAAGIIAAIISYLTNKVPDLLEGKYLENLGGS